MERVRFVTYWHLLVRRAWSVPGQEWLFNAKRGGMGRRLNARPAVEVEGSEADPLRRPDEGVDQRCRPSGVLTLSRLLVLSEGLEPFPACVASTLGRPQAVIAYRSAVRDVLQLDVIMVG